MNHKTALWLIAGALLSLTLINCSSGSSADLQASSDNETSAAQLVSAERPNDFPEGHNTVVFDEARQSYVVTSQQSGCRILVKASEGGTLSIDSEVDCSQ